MEFDSRHWPNFFQFFFAPSHSRICDGTQTLIFQLYLLKLVLFEHRVTEKNPKFFGPPIICDLKHFWTHNFLTNYWSQNF